MDVLLYIINTRKVIKTTILLCFILFTKAAAQPHYPANNFNVIIKGVVIDSTTLAPISGVTLAIEEWGKGLLTKSTVTNDSGSFEVTTLAEQRYQLTFTHTGYKTITVPLPPFTSSTINLGEIALVSVSKELDEIQVASQKPLLEQSLDKLIYNVDADPESKTATALDILRKIPLLTVDADDNLQLNGQSNYRLLINGKSSSLFIRNQSDLFRNLSASAIKTIEVITVPPSRYEALGVGGIINITTYKKNIGGYNGGISTRANDAGEQAANGQLSLKAGKLSLSTNFSHTNNNTPANKNSFIREDKAGQSRLVQTGSGKSYKWAQNGGAELSYELIGHNIISIGYGANRDDETYHHTEQAAFMNTQNGSSAVYRRRSDNRNKQHGNDLSIDYQRNSKKNEEQQLTLSYRRSSSRSKDNGSFTLHSFAGKNKAKSITNNAEHFLEHTAQADYIQPLKKNTLELGVSVLQRQNNSHYFYKDLDTIAWTFVLDSSQSNSFNYGEDIYSGYTSLNLKMGKWGLKTGVRLEAAKVNSHFIASGTALQQEYINLVPNITLIRQLKGISSLRLSYTQRIQRPDLYYLDPYTDRTDPWNISFGNPGLQPALAHVFSLGYNILVKKTYLNLNIFHQSTNNAIQQFTVLHSDTVARTTYGNIGSNRNTSLTLGVNTTLFKTLSINLNGNANYQEYSSFIYGKPHQNEGLTYSTAAGANLRLKTWRFSANLSYNAPNVLLQGKTAGYTSNSATVNKYFLRNNKANISLSATSLFREHRRSFTEINDPAFYLWRESLSIIRRYTLSFYYRFVRVQDSDTGK